MRRSFYILTTCLIFLCLGIVQADSSGLAWEGWARADLNLSKSLNLLNGDLIDCGKVISQFSQGRISKTEAERQAQVLVEKSAAQLAKLSKLDNSSDQHLYACGIDLARQQLRQIKASRELLKKDDVERKDILILQGQQGKLINSQSRFYRARQNSIKNFLSTTKRLANSDKLSRNKIPLPSPSLIEYYRLEGDILQLQIDQLKYSQVLLDNLQRLAREEKKFSPIDLDGIERLRHRSSALAAEGELTQLAQAYVKEMGSFYKTAEAVKLLQQDLSVDSLSRLNRWQGVWQNDSRSASILSASLAEKYLP